MRCSVACAARCPRAPGAVSAEKGLGLRRRRHRVAVLYSVCAEKAESGEHAGARRGRALLIPVLVWRILDEAPATTTTCITSASGWCRASCDRVHAPAQRRRRGKADSAALAAIE